MATTAELISQIYVGYFNRAPDPHGLNYWIGRYNAGMSLADIATSFSVQPESTALYAYLRTPLLGGEASFIAAVYKNLFNRNTVDADGMIYWTGQIASGRPLGEIILDIISGADATDAKIVANKVAAGLYWATEAAELAGLDYENNLAAKDAAKAALSGVDMTDASVAVANAASDAFFSAQNANIGKTITLTSFVDGPGSSGNSIDTDGTNGDDIYLASTATLAGDFIDAKGGNDLLKVIGTGGTITAILSDIERVEVTALSDSTLNLSVATGIETLAAVNGMADVIFDNLSALAALELTGQHGGAVAVNYTPPTISGAADTQNIALSNVGSIAATTVTVNGVEKFNVTLNGSNNIGALAGTTLQAVNVTGGGNLSVATALADTITKFDAAAVTGNISVEFAAGGNVDVKTGSGDDTVNFGTGLTSADAVDLGDGMNILELAGGDYSSASNETLKGINAALGVDHLRFTGSTGATIDRGILVHSEIEKFVFQTTGGDTVTNTGTRIFAFGTSNEGSATFGLEAFNTTLNLALEGSSQTATAAFDDANVGNLSAIAALTINLNSTGTSNVAVDFSSPIVVGNFNSVGTVTAATNATVFLTGDANTQIDGFANGVNLRAGALTGALMFGGSSAADIIIAGKGPNFITGGNGVDVISIAASAGVSDVIDLRGIQASANRDVVTGFEAGAGGDTIHLLNSSTTNSNTGVASVQQVLSSLGSVNFVGTTSDVLELSFDIAGTGLTDDANGAGLLTAIGTFRTALLNQTGFAVAYQAGNAYLYHFNSGASGSLGNTEVSPGELNLVGVFNGVGVGALEASNFMLF